MARPAGARGEAGEPLALDRVEGRGADHHRLACLEPLPGGGVQQLLRTLLHLLLGHASGEEPADPVERQQRAGPVDEPLREVVTRRCVRGGDDEQAAG